MSKGGIVISSLITTVFIIAGVIIFMKFALARKNKTIGTSNNAITIEVSEKEDDTTQSLLGRETVVSNDGFIEVGGVFRICLYVSQVNMRTNADVEKFKVWMSFRSFLNEIGLPYTLELLSQFVDVREYAHMYRERLEKGHLTPELVESGMNVAKHIEVMDENRNSRDYNGYVIFTYDPESDSIDAGVATGNAKIDEIIRNLTGKKNMLAGERESLARMVLDEAANITRSYAEEMGMQCWRLNKGQVYGLTYKILQKDYASFSSPEEASEAKAFTPFHDSITAKTLADDLEGELAWE